MLDAQCNGTVALRYLVDVDLDVLLVAHVWR